MKISVINGGAIFRALPILVFFLFFNSCASNNTANQQNTNKESNTAQIAEKAPAAASDDAEELAKNIKLPLTPEDVRWMPDVAGKNQSTNALAANAPNGKRLVAVLKYSDTDSESLTSQVQKIAPSTPATFIPLEWFPEELIAQSETAGDQSLKGKQYDARDFVQAPYVKGRLIKLEQPGYFILELTTY